MTMARGQATHEYWLSMDGGKSFRLVALIDERQITAITYTHARPGIVQRFVKITEE